jgi:hypothetical protein
MTYLLNLRSHPVGGWLDSVPGVKIQLDPPPNSDGFTQNIVDSASFRTAMTGKHVLIGTHGFNVNFADGVGSLSNWATLLQIDLTTQVFVGALWPGDSIWAHGLDYPEEPRVADDSGRKLGPLLDDLLAEAASVSLVSHSLGARVVLQTLNWMTRPATQLILMAGAIDNDCLANEFKEAAGTVGTVSVLASKGDTILEWLFPIGNLLGGILDDGHPWFRSAIGRGGPAKKNRPFNFQPPYQIPDLWEYNHPNYLSVTSTPPALVSIPKPAVIPPQNTAVPQNGGPGWHEAWSSAVVSTLLK